MLLVEPLVDLEELPQVVALVREDGDLGPERAGPRRGFHGGGGDGTLRRRHAAQGVLGGGVERGHEGGLGLSGEVARLGAVLVEREDEDRRAHLDPVAVLELVREHALPVDARPVGRVAVREEERTIGPPLDHAVAPRHVGVRDLEDVVHGATERHDRLAERNGPRRHSLRVDRDESHDPLNVSQAGQYAQPQLAAHGRQFLDDQERTLGSSGRFSGSRRGAHRAQHLAAPRSPEGHGDSCASSRTTPSLEKTRCEPSTSAV